ncbi:MAG: CHAT domain-containing protein [Acidobacteriota bacterium]
MRSFRGAVFLSLLPLVPGPAAERGLAGGERDSYVLEVSTRPLLVTVDQRGINVALEAHGPGGNDLGASDQAGEREAVESLLLPASPGAWQVDVVALETGVPPGHYRIQVEELSEPGRIEAETLLSEMGRLRKLGDGDSKRRLLALGEKALPAWRQAGLRREEARTLYLMAGARRGLGEPGLAQPLYEQALGLAETTGDGALRSQVLTALGLVRWSLGDHAGALDRFDRALTIERSRGDIYGEAVTLGNVCLVRHSRGEWRESIPCYEEALRRLKDAGAPDSEVISRVNLAGVYDLLGEPVRARAEYEAALVTARTLGYRQIEIQILNNLAVVLAGMGETSAALLLYEQALDLARAQGERGWEGRALYNRGGAYLGLGEPSRAAADLEQALALRRQAGDRRGEISALGMLGRVREQLGETEAARALHRQALALAREAGDRYLEARSLNLLAQADLQASDLTTALAELDQAVELCKSQGDRRGLAVALSGQGEARLLAGRPEEALPFLADALTLRRELEDRAGQAETLVLRSRAERRLGHAGPARESVEEALGLIESLRSDVIVPDLRASFLASRQRAFELAIDLRMELNRAEPGAGHAEAALALSERARARSLLDLLGEARADVRQGVDPQLRERESEVAARLAAKARRRIELLGGTATETQKESSARELQETLAESDRLEAAIRQRNPRYAGLLHPEPLDAAAIRKLLDPDVLLLEYALGEERSWLWAVTSGGVEAFELPARGVIEALAGEVYAGLRTLDAGDPARDAAKTGLRRKLGEILLGPVADRLADRRLAIVADGALQYVPFAVLPPPGGSGAPLIERHEIVTLPSASILALRRPRPEVPAAAGGDLAILADPVFDRGDPRVPVSAGSAPESPDSARAGPALSRLPGSRREAEAIAEVARAAGSGEPPGRVWTALDFQASRAAVLNGDLARYRIVHFATHGVIDAGTPELSGLALSMVDERGEPQAGFLGLNDVYNLDLRADLVVLSGCETALGREMRGEGLIGLTRGFLYAGASQVLASLWQVQDRPSMELMVRFYRALLQDRLPPAAALRTAQLSMIGERRWRDPYYWGAFVLQGDLPGQ